MTPKTTTANLNLYSILIPNIFTIIGQSREFYKKQPVLNSIMLWLVFLPLLGMALLGEASESLGYFQMMESGIRWGETDLRLTVLAVLTQIILSVILAWGIASITVTGKKMLSSSAGRNRSSFKAVRKEGARYILNLFLTGILRDCFTLFWGLLLVVPGVIYVIRTAFYHIAIVCEGLGYRKALSKSKEVVKGHTWTAFWYLLGLSIVIFFPSLIIAGMLEEFARLYDPRLFTAASIVGNTLLSFSVMIFTLCTIVLYGELKKIHN